MIWLPQKGPQTALLTCPVEEIFYGGARGGGKTSGLLGHFLHYQQQYKGDAKGILFRRSYTELDEVVNQAKEMYLPIGATFIESKYIFKFPNGATFKLRYLDKDKDADKYQGHQYSWIGFDELPNWPSSIPIDKLRGCLRTTAGIPKFFIGTGNPGGVGHVWVKERYIDAAIPGEPFSIDLDGVTAWRVFIPSKLKDNQILMRKDPGYVGNLRMSGPDWLVQAWLAGDWNIVAGGYLEGVWRTDSHVCKPIKIDPEWPRWRALDWGFAKPFSVGWYTKDYDGVIYRYRELYGFGGKSNTGTREQASEVARKILDIERDEANNGIVFRNNPADSAIWSEDGHTQTIASMFRADGVGWTAVKKGPRSRINGNAVIVDALKNGKFKVFETCKHFIRTVPVIPADPNNFEDVDTAAEDHAWDEFRYSLVTWHNVGKKGKAKPPPKPGTFDWLTRDEEKQRSKYRR